MIVLVDTNILLDVVLARKPFDAAAARVWSLVETRAINGDISAISLNNLFYIANKQSGCARAMDAVRLVRRVFRIVPLDDGIVDRAIAIAGNDLEDAIQAAAGERVAADCIVTRNARDFASFGIPAVTGEELLAILIP